MLSRAVLLLCCLPALIPAAPAPLARRTKETAESRSWSAPVDGLRVRLLAPQRRYRVGETVRLVMEIQNVSGSTLTLEDPYLNDLVTAVEKPPYGWSITSQVVGEGCPQKSLCEVKQVQRLSALRKLSNRQILRFEIHAAGGPLEAKLEELANDEQPRRVDVHFSDGDSPGSYELRATFARGSDEIKGDKSSTWAGYGLKSLPIRIEITE